MTTNLILATVTAYCHCALCCGIAGSPTASGVMPKVGRTVAAPKSVPFGSWVRLPGMGWRRVEDRLGRKYPKRWDVFMADHRTAKQFGKQQLTITVITK